jgi:hypothetical protein
MLSPLVGLGITPERLIGPTFPNQSRLSSNSRILRNSAK